MDIRTIESNFEYQLKEVFDDMESDYKSEQAERKEDGDDFDHCGDCDLPDACSDFGCAIKTSVREAPRW